MNRWIEQAEEYRSCTRAVSEFLRPNAVMPARVVAQDVAIVGYADECNIRQSKDAFDSFWRHLRLVGEQEFWFHWLDERPEAYRLEHGVYPTFACDSLAPNATSFVDLQRQVDEQEAMEFDRWLLTSPSKKWAIYGEQYNSETCVFLSRDENASSAMRFVFPAMVTDPREVPGKLWDAMDTLDRRLFEAEFLRNYVAINSGR